MTKGWTHLAQLANAQLWATFCGGNEEPKKWRLYSVCFNNTKFFPYFIWRDWILIDSQTHSKLARLYHYK